MKPRYKYIATDGVIYERNSAIEMGQHFEALSRPGHIWYRARRSWILLLRLTESQ